MRLTEERIEEIADENWSAYEERFINLKSFARAIEAEATKPCVCGDSSAQGVFHRNDGPCYIAVEEATTPQEPVAWVEVVDRHEGPYNFHGKELLDSGKHNLYTTPQPCQSCDEKQSYIGVFEGRYADLSAKCAELEAESASYAELQSRCYEGYQSATDGVFGYVKELEAELERERIRLAACGVVALANTPESAAKQREMLPEYESGSLESVKHIVDSEMALRAERDALAMQNQQMRSVLLRLATLGNGEQYGNSIGNCIAQEALALPDTSSIIRRHDAEVLRKAADVCESRQTPGTGSVAILGGAANALREMAAEMEAK